MDDLRLKFRRRLMWGRAACGMALIGSMAAHAAPLLRCQVAYAGTTHTIEARTTPDPYPVASVDIGGRFLFKAVMVGSDRRINYIKLYTYLDASRQPVLIHMARYLPPFKSSKAPYLLTGEQFLYGGPVERELTYRCTLEGAP
jgi:hypothetical protein